MWTDGSLMDGKARLPHDIQEADSIGTFMTDNNLLFDLICTQYPHKAQRLLKHSETDCLNTAPLRHCLIAVHIKQSKTACELHRSIFPLWWGCLWVTIGFSSLSSNALCVLSTVAELVSTLYVTDEEICHWLPYHERLQKVNVKTHAKYFFIYYYTARKMF